MKLLPLKRNILPEPPKSVLQLLGPSFILLGLGLGTGELIMWPYLTANWGMGIIWGALIGITIQYFLNMEIERYSLVNGESIFVGFARLFKYLPIWFVISTALAWLWPAFSFASASVLANLLGQSGIGTNSEVLAIIMLIIVGMILTLGPSLYKTVESVEKVLILISIPVILFIAVVIIKFVHLEALFWGLLGFGDGYWAVPFNVGREFPLMTFLAAFAYSGAGGNLLLAQSFYIKEKGYAMGKYASKISSIVTGKREKYEIEGTTFNITPEEIQKFNKWWKVSSQEHLIVFWGMGLFTMLTLATISYATVYGQTGYLKDLQFLFFQSEAVNTQTGFLGSTLLIITAVMLFSTQLSVIDGASRIISENIAILFKDKIDSSNLPLIYYISVWMLIAFGITVLAFGASQPQSLIITGAVINAFCMFVFSGLLNPVNKRFLPDQVHAPKWRSALITSIFVFLGIFSIAVLIDTIL